MDNWEGGKTKEKKTNPGPHSWFLDKPQSQKRDLTGENGPKVQFLAQCRLAVEMDLRVVGRWGMKQY